MMKMKLTFDRRLLMYHTRFCAPFVAGLLIFRPECGLWHYVLARKATTYSNSTAGVVGEADLVSPANEPDLDIIGDAQGRYNVSRVRLPGEEESEPRFTPALPEHDKSRDTQAYNFSLSFCSSKNYDVYPPPPYPAFLTESEREHVLGIVVRSDDGRKTQNKTVLPCEEAAGGSGSAQDRKKLHKKFEVVGEQVHDSEKIASAERNRNDSGRNRRELQQDHQIQNRAGSCRTTFDGGKKTLQSGEHAPPSDRDEAPKITTRPTSLMSAEEVNEATSSSTSTSTSSVEDDNLGAEAEAKEVGAGIHERRSVRSDQRKAIMGPAKHRSGAETENKKHLSHLPSEARAATTSRKSRNTHQHARSCSTPTCSFSTHWRFHKEMSRSFSASASSKNGCHAHGSAAGSRFISASLHNHERKEVQDSDGQDDREDVSASTNSMKIYEEAEAHDAQEGTFTVDDEGRNSHEDEAEQFLPPPISRAVAVVNMNPVVSPTEESSTRLLFGSDEDEESGSLLGGAPETRITSTSIHCCTSSPRPHRTPRNPWLCGQSAAASSKQGGRTSRGFLSSARQGTGSQREYRPLTTGEKLMQRHLLPSSDGEDAGDENSLAVAGGSGSSHASHQEEPQQALPVPAPRHFCAGTVTLFQSFMERQLIQNKQQRKQIRCVSPLSCRADLKLGPPL
ncbi:unnamed protein product [Amoebophrya sp. A120]|nr:unnamed protein product [Amoebophrya sp. A120]|eukprot:GSA120T00010692001.1